ncbi:DUF1003 domain-containing protein [Rhizobium leguminosarum]|uniref:DUF1003 domain-containing protein n=1 Tax=Rhizobium leguminosarum TaxID=384 RepID=UPI001C94BDDC|nr:DUF1003 domain-containing protein [Rhizobium leguminosarum]MBY5407836.1 DUF1003 domain-containing protein [Rhizobium leguminosarum]
MSAPRSEQKQSTISRRLDRNIEALLKRREEEARQSSRQERVADAITRFAGSMKFVYLHLLVVTLWIIFNIGLLPLMPVFDPSFVILAMVASVEAIFISTFVLISQNRMTEADDKRADLNLQICLLAEHETTELLTLVSAIAEKLGIEIETTEELEELKEQVRPEEVLDEIEEKMHRRGTTKPPPA